MRALLALSLLFAAQVSTAAQLLQGSRTAKVQVLIYGDYECPFTGLLIKQLPQWEKKWGNEIGVSFAHFPLAFHDHARPAAIAAVCADRQDAFAKYSLELFANQRALSNDQFKKIALAQSLHMNSFEQCLADPQVARQVDDEIAAGNAHHVTGTPNVFINGERVDGAYPFEHFEGIIDRLLKAK